MNCADSGVYVITNLISRKKYVGQSLGIRQRWLAHVRKKSCLALFSALEKYGKENFSFEIVYCTNDREEMNRVETLLIKENNSMYPNGYNLLGGGDAPEEMAEYVKDKIRQSLLNGASYMKGKKHSPETIAKMSATRKAQGNFRTGTKHSEETKKLMSKAMMGKKASEETKALFREISKGNTHAKGHVLSLEARKKISDALTGRPSPKKGIKVSEETIAKMRVCRIGYVVSEETKQKLRKPWSVARREAQNRRKTKELNNATVY